MKRVRMLWLLDEDLAVDLFRFLQCATLMMLQRGGKTLGRIRHSIACWVEGVLARR